MKIKKKAPFGGFLLSKLQKKSQRLTKEKEKSISLRVSNIEKTPNITKH